MKICKKRIQSPVNYLAGIPLDGKFFIGLSNLNEYALQLSNIGFGQSILMGHQLLPSIIGRITRFNADGGFKIRKDLPKEEVVRKGNIKDWHGYLHTVNIPYKRYPRDPIQAPNIELVIQKDAKNDLMITSPLLINSIENHDLIKHIMNMFLEIFKEFEVYQEDLIPSINLNVKRLNWDILPKGNYPWQALEPRIQSIIDNTNEDKKTIVLERIKLITSFNPNFVAVGNAGFHGYIVFGFPNKDFKLLESMYSGNATYIFGQNWEELSQLSKEQIITQNLFEKRIVHTDLWSSEIKVVLN